MSKPSTGCRYPNRPQAIVRLQARKQERLRRMELTRQIGLVLAWLQAHWKTDSPSQVLLLCIAMFRGRECDLPRHHLLEGRRDGNVNRNLTTPNPAPSCPME